MIIFRPIMIIRKVKENVFFYLPYYHNWPKNDHTWSVEIKRIQYHPLPKKRPCGKACGDLAASLLLLCRRPTARLRQCVFTMQMNLAAGLL